MNLSGLHVHMTIDKSLGLGDQGLMPIPNAAGNSETDCPKLVPFVFFIKRKAVKGSLLVFLTGYHPKRKC